MPACWHCNYDNRVALRKQIQNSAKHTQVYSVAKLTYDFVMTFVILDLYLDCNVCYGVVVCGVGANSLHNKKLAARFQRQLEGSQSEQP